MLQNLEKIYGFFRRGVGKKYENYLTKAKMLMYFNVNDSQIIL